MREVQITASEPGVYCVFLLPIFLEVRKKRAESVQDRQSSVEGKLKQLKDEFCNHWNCIILFGWLTANSFSPDYI